jgi:hypothetical protein
MPILLKIIIAFYAWLAYKAFLAAKILPKFGGKKLGGGGVSGYSAQGWANFNSDLYRRNKDTTPTPKIDRSKALNIENWAKEQLNK